MSKFRETNYSIVLESQCDELGHMNIQYYFATLSDTMFNFMSIVGVPTSEISIRKTSFVLFKQDSEFIEELTQGAEFRVGTSLEYLGRKSLVLQHRFLNMAKNTISYKARFVCVFLDLEERRGVAIPDWLKTAIKHEFPIYIDDTEFRLI
jgi:acyl-CoA thioesterase FadM